GRERGRVALRDLRKRAVAAAAIPAVVARPVRLRRDGARRHACRACRSQQVQLAVVTKELRVELALVEHQSSERTAALERHVRPLRRGARSGLQRPYELNQRSDLSVAEVRERRHAGRREALAEYRRQLLIRSRRDASGDSRSELAAIAVTAV